MAEMLKKKPASRPQEAPVDEMPSHPLAKCKPRGDRVVVRRDIARRESAGGILMPESFSNEKQQTGTVWSVGPGRYEAGVLIPIELKKGDRVVITGYAGLEINDPLANTREEFVLLRDDDIVAILTT